jgi:hypothetical protein
MQIQNHTVQLASADSQKTSAAVITEREVSQINGQDNNTAVLTTQTKTSKNESFDAHSKSVVKHTGNAQQTELETSALSKRLVETTLDEEITITRAASQPNSENQNAVQLQVATVMTYEQDESLTSRASGVVTTEDGREVSFLLELNYQRNSQIETTTEFAGNRDLIDPIVINLSGEVPSFSDTVFEFDINRDGQLNSIYQTRTGTGFLAFDKNNNGFIDDGHELFGPQSGQGFTELAVYDSDGNGWIDEGDTVFSQLGFLDFDENGAERLRSLEEVGFGAIYLGAADAKFDLYTSEGDFSAQIQRSGFGLMENGAAVAVQEVNFASNIHTVERSLGNPQLTDEFGNTINATNPLAAVQIQNDLVSARISETEVRLNRETTPGLRVVENAFRPSTQQVLNPVNSSSQNTGIDNQNITFESTIREQIAARMQEATFRNNQKSLEDSHSNQPNIVPPILQFTAPEAKEFRFLENLPNRLSNGINRESNQMTDLRATIDALKTMKDQQDRLLEKLGILEPQMR